MYMHTLLISNTPPLLKIRNEGVQGTQHNQVYQSYIFLWLPPMAWRERPLLFYGIQKCLLLPRTP